MIFGAVIVFGLHLLGAFLTDSTWELNWDTHLQTVENDTVNSRYLEVVGTIFYKFKLPEVQINLHFG